MKNQLIRSFRDLFIDKNNKQDFLKEKNRQKDTIISNLDLLTVNISKKTLITSSITKKDLFYWQRIVVIVDCSLWGGAPEGSFLNSYYTEM